MVRRQNEEDVILPSHKAKIWDKSGMCQQCMASWRLLANRAQELSHMNQYDIRNKTHDPKQF